MEGCKRMEKYSVLITVYKDDNPENFKLALLSIIKQTVKPDEIVLVKDGPVPKNIQDVIDVLDKENPKLIHQVQLPQNKGLGLALNEGIKVCRNELVARMDSDDISVSTRCERELAEFEKNPNLDIIGCPVLEFEGNTDNIVGRRNVPFDNKSIYKFARKRDPFNHPTVMYRKSKVEAVGGYGDLRKNQDTDLWIKMLSNGAVCMNLTEPLFYFRFDSNTYKKRKNWLNTKLLITIRKNAYKTGFCSLIDFFEVAIAQLLVYLLPVWFQEFIYKKILRRENA